jgi:hypothetical protein
MRHDLFQRRIGNQKGGDDAGHRRVGAAKFKRGRRAIGLRVARIGGQPGRDLVGAADDRIEAVVSVTAVELGTDLVLQGNARIIETTTRGDREGLGDVECIERVKSGILIGRAQ